MLRRAGAKYGPEDRSTFLAEAPIKRLESVLGKIQVKTVRFNLGLAGNAMLGWEMEIEARPEGVGPIQYVLRFEPFEGKLVWMDQL